MHIAVLQEHRWEEVAKMSPEKPPVGCSEWNRYPKDPEGSKTKLNFAMPEMVQNFLSGHVRASCCGIR